MIYIRCEKEDMEVSNSFATVLVYFTVMQQRQLRIND